jgi:hypothetical protein
MQAQPGENSLASNQFNDDRKDKANHGSSTIQALNVVIESIFRL